jgi:hypothetical protein
VRGRRRGGAATRNGHHRARCRFRRVRREAFAGTIAFLLRALQAAAQSAPPDPAKIPQSPPLTPERVKPAYAVTDIPVIYWRPEVLFEFSPVGFTFSDSLVDHDYTFFARLGGGITRRQGRTVFGSLAAYEFSTQDPATFDLMLWTKLSSSIGVQAGGLLDTKGMPGAMVALGYYFTYERSVESVERVLYYFYPSAFIELQRRAFDGKGPATSLILKLSYPIDTISEEHPLVNSP